ncbi:pentatricopeptide repeat-containing protein At1g71420-like [Vitis riparia]|uniref:pentatricopeptide repeat-containing protein At1g71420-like n=1 Tax=Vitis riparia TaxID=96939 RepID=UPI00155B1A9A|nr:pentatricopeptide repeat-containing protein At1g71420-like [Vitis riparia]
MLGLFGDVFSGFFRGFSTTGVSLNSEAINLLHHIRLLCSRGHLQEALKLFYSITPPPPLVHSHHTYAALFQACARRSSLSLGQALHCHMLLHNPNSDFNLFLTNHVVNMYAKCGSLDYAHQMFDEMPETNIVSWTALVSGYAQHGRSDECFRVFRGMLIWHRPTEFAFASVISACGGDDNFGRQVHALALKTSFDSCVYVGNALIMMYCKSCGGADEAWNVYEAMGFRNLVSWNSMIAGFQVCGCGNRALELFSQMHIGGIRFDRATLVSIFPCLCGMGDGLECCFQLQCLTIKTGFISKIEVATALVKAYSSLGGEVSDCYRIFLELDGRQDVVSWTGIIAAFAERDPKEALLLFRQFLRECLAPDRHMFSIVLKACAGLATERHALTVQSHVLKVGFEGDTVLANALIHACARCGSVALSKQAFDKMGSRDIVSWNSMLKAYAMHGQGKEALQLFSQMDAQPDGATFVALLSACSHAGMVEDGAKIFETMSNNHGIVPQLDHYACMVDILGRAGQISEAKELIDKMPMEPDSVVWSALLGSCRKHGETKLAKLAAVKIKELDPNNSLGYILMSNIFCTDGRFNEARLIRREMEGKTVRKEPGLSWIEVGNQVHEFASGGQQHPEKEAICARLEELVRRLKDLGYMPQISLALHDIEDEHKEEQLYYHSEKLALVFALMNVGSMCCNGNTIKIMKNIRICVDCHNFMKLASELVDMEIVVRDSNRFHHFKAKLCSCNDYW